MLPQDLQPGHAYYRVTYADDELTIPGVRPMIYVGSNIFPDDDPASVMYYFQDTVSHSRLGSVADAANDWKNPEVEAEVFPHTAADVERDVLTLAEVVVALTKAQKRARDSSR